MINRVFDLDSLPCLDTVSGEVEPKCGHFSRFVDNEVLGYADINLKDDESRLQMLEHIVGRFIESGFCPFINQLKNESRLGISLPPPSTSYDHGQCPNLKAHEKAKLN